MIILIEEYNARLKYKLPPKLKDLESFTIPYNIGNKHVYKTLCDLGASINLMSLSLFKKLDLREVKASTILFQLVNRLIK